MLNWTGPFKILAVGPYPAADTPDGRPLGDKLLYLDLPSNLSGPAAKPRVTVARCKPFANPYDANDILRHLPAGLTQYVFHAFATKSPPYHVTTDDVSAPPTLIDVAKITGQQCVRGRGGTIAVLHETHWNVILRPTWERELDLQAFRHLILAYWANVPDHHQPNTPQYQQLRINAAARKIARAKGERHLPSSYRLVTNDVYRTRFLSTPLPLTASPTPCCPARPALPSTPLQNTRYPTVANSVRPGLRVSCSPMTSQPSTLHFCKSTSAWPAPRRPVRDNERTFQVAILSSPVRDRALATF